MQSIHSFDPEYIKLHNKNGTRFFYLRKYISSDVVKGYRLLLRLRKKNFLLRAFQLNRKILKLKGCWRIQQLMLYMIIKKGD